jgi:hypothetical protein
MFQFDDILAHGITSFLFFLISEPLPPQRKRSLNPDIPGVIFVEMCSLFNRFLLRVL